MKKRPEYICKGCDEINSITEVSLVPRDVLISPNPDEPGQFEYGDDKAYWEGEILKGYACRNSSCKFFWSDPHSMAAKDPLEIADITSVEW